MRTGQRSKEQPGHAGFVGHCKDFKLYSETESVKGSGNFGMLESKGTYSSGTPGH